MDAYVEENLKLIESYKILHDRMEAIAEDYIRINNGREIDTIDSVTIDGEYIEVEGRNYSHCGCCGDDYESYEIPISYLWNPDWREDLREELTKRNLEALKKKEAEKKEKERKDKEAEYKRFLELKEKFDDR